MSQNNRRGKSRKLQQKSETQIYCKALQFFDNACLNQFFCSLSSFNSRNPSPLSSGLLPWMQIQTSFEGFAHSYSSLRKSPSNVFASLLFLFCLFSFCWQFVKCKKQKRHITATRWQAKLFVHYVVLLNPYSLVFYTW